MAKLFSEDDLLMLSALQHLLFCPRQCALIHVEQLWIENRLTAEGRILHERVHTAAKESRRTIRLEFDMPIRSLELGLIGRADVVEFHLQDNGVWQPYPVEYKRGRPKKDDSDRVQLCAQALCLEEMLSVDVPVGALYYGKKKRRSEVEFDQNLRTTTIEAARTLHDLFQNRRTPPPQYSRRCDNCSFVELCLPRTVGKKNKVANYMKRMIKI
jgi:CRISPR-associated exonuclease Cas4